MEKAKYYVLSLVTLLSLLFCTPLYSQFVDFGRNKVQYSEFDWYTMSTDHFKIYYYKESKELAEIGASYAEESYKVLQQKFNHSLMDTVPLIFYASPIHFKQTNTTEGFIPDGVGGFTEFVKGRVVLPFEGSMGQFYHVIRHELTHVFMISKLNSILRNHGKLSERTTPLWYTEGLAEYWSFHWDTQSEMVLKDAVLHDFIVGLDDWETYYGTYMMYKLGQKVLEYIAETYGEDKVLQLMENFWISESFSDVLKFTIGKDYKEFDKDFLYFLKKHYFPQYANLDDAANTSKMIYFNGFSHKPAFNPKTNEVYFIGNNSGYTSVFKTSLNSNNNSKLVVQGESSDEYEQFHFFRSGMDISSSGKLAFVTQKGPADAIHIYDTFDNKLIADYSFKDLVNIGAPSWSKDGNKIVFPATDFGGKSDLYYFDIEKNNLRRLTNDYYDDRDPSLSPDGNTIVFSSDRTSYGKGSYNLFLYDLHANTISYLTNGTQTDNSPFYNDDGTKIAFTSDLGGPQNIWMIDLNKKDTLSGYIEMRRLTDFISAAYDPKWAGADRLVFSTYERGGINVRMIDRVSLRYDSSKVINKIDPLNTGQSYTLAKIESIPQKNSLKYNKEYSLDIATSSITSDPVFGTNAGGVISMSDLLGNEKYYFLFFSNSNSDEEFFKSINIAVSKVSVEKRMNYAYGVYHLSGKRSDLGESDFTYYERLFGGYLSLSYPMSFFKRFETSVSLSESNKNVDFLDNRRALLLSNTISYVHDNSLWYYTGPIDGERLNLTLGYTTDVENSTTSYYSVLFDYRKYLRISPQVALAFRGQYFMNEGKNPRRFYMGGSWSLRGWPRNDIRGTKLWQANAELRFPLINNLSLNFPLGINLNFPGIRGALFFDAGNAFDSFETYGETKGSIGAGLRANILGIIVMRYDIGKRIENNFKTLSGGLFQQVFFGWDF